MSNSIINSQEQEDDYQEEQEEQQSIDNDNTKYPKFNIINLQQLTNIERKANKNKKVGIDLTNTKYEILFEVCKEFNWTIYKNYPKFDDWLVSWHDFYIQEDYLRRMQPYQKINRFPGSYNLGKKNYLGKHLTKMRKKYEKEYDFVPRTWVLPYQYEELKQFNQNSQSLHPKQKNVYIVKPESSCQGKGIFLTKKIENTLNSSDHYVVQEYIKNPYLVDNLKFDFRLYVLVKSIKPLKIFLYREGLTRFATTEYKKPNKKNMNQLTMHLTNYAVNKKSKDFVFNQKEQDDGVGHKRSFSSVLQTLKDQGKNVDKLMIQIRKLIIKTICCVQPNLQHLYKSGQSKEEFSEMSFEVFGFDIMIDNKLKPYLIEVNHTPSFQTDTPLDYQIKKHLIMDTLILVNIKNKAKKKYFENKEKNVPYLKGQSNKISVEDMEKLNQKIENYENKHLNGYIRIYPFLDEKKKIQNILKEKENKEEEINEQQQNQNYFQMQEEDIFYNQNYYNDEEDYDQYMKQAKIIQDEFTGVKSNKQNVQEVQNLPPRPPTNLQNNRQNSNKILRRPQSGIVTKPTTVNQTSNSQLNSSFQSLNNGNSNDTDSMSVQQQNSKKDFISMNKKNLMRFSRQNKNQNMQSIFQEKDIQPNEQQVQINQYQERIQQLQQQQSFQNQMQEKEFCNVDTLEEDSFNFINQNNLSNYQLQNNSNNNNSSQLSQQIQNTCTQGSSKKIEQKQNQILINQGGKDLSFKLDQLKIELKNAQDEAQVQLEMQQKFNSQSTTNSGFQTKHQNQIQQFQKQQKQSLLNQNPNHQKMWKVQNNNYIMKNIYQQQQQIKEDQNPHLIMNYNNNNNQSGSHSHSVSREFGNISNTDQNYQNKISSNRNQVQNDKQQKQQQINGHNNYFTSNARKHRKSLNQISKSKSQKDSFSSSPTQQQQQYFGDENQYNTYQQQQQQKNCFYNGEKYNNYQHTQSQFAQNNGVIKNKNNNINNLKNNNLFNKISTGSTYQYQQEKEQQVKLKQFQLQLQQKQDQKSLPAFNQKQGNTYMNSSAGNQQNSKLNPNSNLNNNNFQMVQNSTKIQAQINQIYRKNKKALLQQQQNNLKGQQGIPLGCKLLNKQEKQGIIQLSQNSKQNNGLNNNSNNNNINNGRNNQSQFQKQYYQNINIVKQQYYNH